MKRERERKRERVRKRKTDDKWKHVGREGEKNEKRKKRFGELGEWLVQKQPISIEMFEDLPHSVPLSFSS